MPRNGQREVREVDRFTAYDDGNNAYTIVIYRTYEWCQVFQKNGRWVGLSRKASCNGKPINRINDNTYEITDWPKNVIVRRK